MKKVICDGCNGTGRIIGRQGMGVLVDHTGCSGRGYHWVEDEAIADEKTAIKALKWHLVSLPYNDPLWAKIKQLVSAQQNVGAEPQSSQPARDTH